MSHHGMSTRADFALPGLVGALVVVAVLFTIWVARDSSADTEAAQPMHEHPRRGLYSARSHRSPVTRTAIPLEQQPGYEPHPTSGATTR